MIKSFDRDRIISWSILFIAVLFRLASLSLKPPHGDEGVNGHFINLMWENGFYRYDPTNFHGPLLFYLQQISEKIFGFGINSLRIVTVLFSVLTVWLALRCRDILGQYGSYFTALILAVSPGMIFFGRSAIHESVFVFFQVIWIAGFLRLQEQMNRKALQWFLFGILGSVLLKETFLIIGISFFLAWGWLSASPLILRRIRQEFEKPPGILYLSGISRKKNDIPDKTSRSGKKAKKQPSVSSPPIEPVMTDNIVGDVDRNFFIKTVVVVLCIWLALFTGFFQNMKGAKDFFIALAPWLKTGVGGAGHDKPFMHWISLFRQYEWVGVVGIAGAFAGIISRSWKMRFLSFFALVNGLIYSLIPYKTPWCVISILWPFVFIAGIWIEFVINEKANKRYSPILLASIVIAVLLIGRSATTAYELNFVHYADTSPYVYVQVKNEFKVLEKIVQKKLRTGPDMQNIIVQSCLLTESWPLPWFFSRFPNYRYGNSTDSFDLNSDIIFADVTRNAPELSGLYLRRKTDMRESRELMYIYLKRSSFRGIDLTGFESFPGTGSGGA